MRSFIRGVTESRRAARRHAAAGGARGSAQTRFRARAARPRRGVWAQSRPALPCARALSGFVALGVCACATRAQPAAAETRAHARRAQPRGARAATQRRPAIASADGNGGPHGCTAAVASCTLRASPAPCKHCARGGALSRAAECRAGRADAGRAASSSSPAVRPGARCVRSRRYEGGRARGRLKRCLSSLCHRCGCARSRAPSSLPPFVAAACRPAARRCHAPPRARTEKCAAAAPAPPRRGAAASVCAV